MPTNEWKRANQKSYGLSYNYKSGIPDAIERAAKDKGLKPNLYLRMIIEEKLIEDGYLQQDSAYAGPHGTLKLPKD